jgi:monoterpene epsilon-lactone hydrolase
VKPALSEIDAIRALLTAKPRPVGWAERRARIDEIGATWPVAPDVKLEEAELDGVPGEWSRCCSFTAAAIARARSSAIAGW